MKITKCTGEGQAPCKRCSDKGKWNRMWMCFLYKIEGYKGCYCSECVKEITGQTEIEVLKEEYAKCVKENMFNEEINTIDCLLIVRLLNNNTFENETDKLLAERLKKKITKKIKKELSRKQLKGGATDNNVGSKTEKGGVQE